MNKFAERLKDLRLERKLSQGGLAKATGFSQVAICLWEKGERVPSIDAIVVLVKFFGVTSDFLIGITDF